MAHKIVLFLGAGGNVGAASVAKFKEKGYKVAAVSRNPVDAVRVNSDLVISADLSDPFAVKGIFEKVEKELGVPSVIVYNSYSWAIVPGEQTVLSEPLEGLIKDFAVNTTSVYAAAQEAVNAFEKLPTEVHKTFIFTGNKGNTAIAPDVLGLAITKSATWYLIQALAASASTLKAKNVRFYYADERTPEGKGMRFLSGPAHAEFFLQLMEQDSQGPVLATFVRGKNVGKSGEGKEGGTGFVKFEGDERAYLPLMAMSDLAEVGYGA